jgi:hypothetical protein
MKFKFVKAFKVIFRTLFIQVTKIFQRDSEPKTGEKTLNAYSSATESNKTSVFSRETIESLIVVRFIF